MLNKAYTTSAWAGVDEIRATGGLQRSAFNQSTVPSDSAHARRKRRRNGVRLYHETWKLARDNYVDADKLNWDRWEHRFDDEIKSVACGLKYANKMLSALKDGYSQLEVRKGKPEKEEPAVSTQILPGNVGYLQLKSFTSGTTAKQLRRGLLALHDCDALVIDMRDNYGGLVLQAIDCAGLFMREGNVGNFVERIWRSPNSRSTTVFLEGRYLLKRIVSGDTERLSRKKRRYACVVKKKTPVIVLVNKGTASSAEILTAALQENRRALIVGETTFGKGIGQTTHMMPNNTYLDLTSFRIYTPSGLWVGDARRKRVGIKPDIEVAGKGRVYRSSLKRDKQLYTAWKRLTGEEE